MTTEMLGVCCDCHEPHPVRPAEVGLWEWGAHQEEIDREGEQVGWVMCEHTPTFGGAPCPGAGTTPQAVFAENTLPKPRLKRFRLHWLDGSTQDVEGTDIADAFTRAGYGQGALPALDYYKPLEDKSNHDDLVPPASLDSGA